MYNYPFKDNNEHVLNEATNINIKCLNKQMLVNILLTNKNVLIFYDTERDSALKTSTAQIYPQYEVMLSIDLWIIKLLIIIVLLILMMKTWFFIILI